ncbi:Aldehyde oxidase GLOX [Vitis vinifera]|uniref:Aldehyde oxidase GLOX n=1 Tax=Vitis vinifera TaxID=29760 RepID=A0A438GDH0_VITVI|nr:Aldehyde oxidase GLOX [Vitis vinifera]
MITAFILLSIFFTVFSAPDFSQTLPATVNQGEWHLLHASIGISAMHMQLLWNNKVVIFDRTDFGPSNLSLPPHLCRHDPRDHALQTDCTAHSLLYCVDTNTFRPLKVQTDTWCSSGSVLPNGTLTQTGGFNDGDHVLRMFTPCDDYSCDWVEFPGYLSQRRWYASNQILPDGRIIIVGGRRQFNYEFYPRSSRGSNSYTLDFLRETRDANENNLYPFLHLLPDGNLFIFANTRSISLDYKRNRVVQEFPQITGGEPRNYPSSGSSVLLPINETQAIEAEVLVCGGAPPGAVSQALRGNFVSASLTCGRLKVTHENPNWVMEEMPVARVMGDMLLLPTGDVIIINGARLGAAGWEYGRSPVTNPVIYMPFGDVNRRFLVMSGSIRPRMYHSSAVLLPDGRILVGGSNPHVYYNFTNVLYPTDLSLEAYSPPYTSPAFSSLRPHILSLDENLLYGQSFSIVFNVCEYTNDRVLSANIVAPSFTTHTVAMNQRMVVLRVESVMQEAGNTYRLSVVGPSTPEIAPPGYYMLFVVHSGIPSHGSWVKIH